MALFGVSWCVWMFILLAECQLQFYTAATTPTHCRNPDYKYVASLGTCYKLYNHVEKTQADARRTCQHEQADLLVLRNVTEEQYFLNLHFNILDEQHGRYWLGGERVPGHNRNRYDDFRWYNGHVLSSDLRWITGEPNNYRNSEDCLTFSYFRSARPLQFALNDDRCTTRHFFICEELPPRGTARGPVCYSCHQQAAEDSSDQLQACDSTESCFLSPVYSSTNTPLFTSGCRQIYACETVAAIGRRNLLDTHCTGCCTTDYCNRNCTTVHNNHSHPGPTAKPPSNTAPSNTATQTSTTAAATAATMTTTSPGTLEEHICKVPGYKYANIPTFRTCYKLYTDVPRTWQQARDRCKQDGGDLIVFQNMDEQNYFIYQTQKSHYLKILRFWVGANDTNHDNATLRWLDGSPVNASFFHAGEPNNRAGKEHCVTLAQFILTDNVIALNDDICSTATNSICEIPVKACVGHGTADSCRHVSNYVCADIYKAAGANCLHFCGFC